MGLPRKSRMNRWEKCQMYIRRTTSLPEAKALGKREGFSAPTTAWITAFMKMLPTSKGHDRG